MRNIKFVVPIGMSKCAKINKHKPYIFRLNSELRTQNFTRTSWERPETRNPKQKTTLSHIATLLLPTQFYFSSSY